MSGKSNLIEVFRLLTRVVTSPASGVVVLAKAFDGCGGFPDSTWKGSDSNLISISLDGDLPLDSEDARPLVWNYEISIVGDSRGWITVHDEVLRVSGPNARYNLIDKADGERVLKNPDGTVISRVPDRSRSALEFEIPDWQGNAIRRLIGSWRFYRLVPQLMKRINPSTAAAFLTEFGDNISSWLMTLQTRHQESFAKIKSVSMDMFPELADLFTSPTQQATVFVASREKHLKHPISVWEMSDGQLCFMALLSLIYSPVELEAPLYCVEEPENHLHPRLLETLVELLRQVQGDLGPERSAQVMITTHSPHLVDKVELDELIVTERREGATYFTRPRDKRHLQELLVREEAGLGDLYYSGALSSV